MDYDKELEAKGAIVKVSSTSYVAPQQHITANIDSPESAVTQAHIGSRTHPASCYHVSL